MEHDRPSPAWRSQGVKIVWYVRTLAPNEETAFLEQSKSNYSPIECACGFPNRWFVDPF